MGATARRVVKLVGGLRKSFVAKRPFKVKLGFKTIFVEVVAHKPYAAINAELSSVKLI